MRELCGTSFYWVFLGIGRKKIPVTGIDSLFHGNALNPFASGEFK
jgi:hypothetical protein